MPGPFQGALYNQINNSDESSDPMHGARTGNIVTDVVEGVRRRFPGQGPQPTPQESPQVQGPVDPWNVNPERNNPAGPVAEQEALRGAEAARRAAGTAQKGEAKENVELRTAIAQMSLAEQKLAEANSYEAHQAAALAVEVARLNVARLQLELKKLNDPNLDPRAIAEFQSELNVREQQLAQEATAALQNQRIRAEWDQLKAQIDATKENQLLQIAASAEQNKLNRESSERQNLLSTGAAVRGQDLSRQSAIDQFNVEMTANKIKSGELSVDRAYKVMEMDISQRRLPSEIARNIGEAIAPMVPHLTSYKKGDIPIGFEAGGPFEIAMRQSGAQSYDPNQYAANPVKMDIMGMAKNAGAQVVNRPMQDPNTAIPNPQIDTSGQATPIPENLQMPTNVVSDLSKQLAASLAQTAQLNQR